MKKILSLLVMLLGNYAVNAQPYSTFNQPSPQKLPDAYIVVDSGFYNASMTSEYKQMFRSRMLGFNLGIGYYFNDYFSAELSYFWSDNLRKSFDTVIGTSFLGMQPTANVTHRGQFKIANATLDLHYHIFRYSYFRPFIGFGAGWTKQFIDFRHSNATDAISIALDTISRTKSRFFFRSSVGFDVDLPNNFGVRFLYRYDIISKVSVTSSIAALPARPLNGGNFFSIGLFYSFYS